MLGSTGICVKVLQYIPESLVRVTQCVEKTAALQGTERSMEYHKYKHKLLQVS